MEKLDLLPPGSPEPALPALPARRSPSPECQLDEVSLASPEQDGPQQEEEQEDTEEASLGLERDGFQSVVKVDLAEFSFPSAGEKTCSVCRKEFPSGANLRKHFVRHDSSGSGYKFCKVHQLGRVKQYSTSVLHASLLYTQYGPGVRCVGGRGGGVLPARDRARAGALPRLSHHLPLQPAAAAAPLQSPALPLQHLPQGTLTFSTSIITGES